MVTTPEKADDEHGKMFRRIGSNLELVLFNKAVRIKVKYQRSVERVIYYHIVYSLDGYCRFES